jgi:hypothetical protein
MSVDLGITTFRQQMKIVRADGHAELAALRCPVHIIASADDQMRSLQKPNAWQQPPAAARWMCWRTAAICPSSNSRNKSSVCCNTT